MRPPEPLTAWLFSCFQLSWVFIQSLFYIVKWFSSWRFDQNWRHILIWNEYIVLSLLLFFSSIFHFSAFTILSPFFPQTIRLFRSDDISPPPLHCSVSLFSIFSLGWAELTLMMGPVVTAILQIGSEWLKRGFSPPWPLTGNGILYTFLHIHISSSAKNLPPSSLRACVREWKIVDDLKSTVASGK